MEKGYYYIILNLHMKMVGSQSTIKMEKGYYTTMNESTFVCCKSQSTIKMEKGYYNHWKSHKGRKLQSRNPQ